MCCDEEEDDVSINEDQIKKIGNPTYTSNKELIEKLKILNIHLPDDSKQNLILYHCLRVGTLSQDEWKNILRCFSVIKCHLQTCVKDKELLQVIEKIVLIASKFNALASRLFNAWIMECYEIGDPNDVFERTFKNNVFMKNIFRCGRIQYGQVDPLLSNSDAFRLCSLQAPSLEEMTELLPLDAWGNIFNSLTSTYKASFREHVTRHIHVRLCSHLKRIITSTEGYKLKKVKYQVIVSDGTDDNDFLLSQVYDNIGENKINGVFPDFLQQEFQMLKNISGSSWIVLKKTKNKEQQEEIRFNRQLFDLHLYIQSKVPFDPNSHHSRKQNKTEEKTKYSKEEVKEEQESQEINYKYKGKGFSPAPITKLGRVFVTMDNKVLNGLKKLKFVADDTTLETTFKISRQDFKERKKALRKKMRKDNYNKNSNKKRRFSMNTNGCGTIPKNSVVSSILTDGVSLCVRYKKFDEDRMNWLQTWDGVYNKDRNKEDNSKPPKKPMNEVLTEQAQKEYTHLIKQGVVRLISLDPGREEIFHTATRSGDGFEEHRFKRSKYIEVSLRNKATEHNESKKTQEIRSFEGRLALHGGWKARTKENYLRVYTEWMTDDMATKIIAHYCDVEFALWKMRLYRRRESILIQRFKQMIGHKYTCVNGVKTKVCIIVGYGAAKIGNARKGEVSVPTARNAMLLRKYLRSRNIPSTVIEVWEHLTSQMCHKCQQRMCNIVEEGRVIRGLKLCKSSTCSTENNPAFRSRDGNAARNILECLEAMVKGQQRPQYLCRQENLEGNKKRKTKAKTIKKVLANP